MLVHTLWLNRHKYALTHTHTHTKCAMNLCDALHTYSVQAGASTNTRILSEQPPVTSSTRRIQNNVWIQMSAIIRNITSNRSCLTHHRNAVCFKKQFYSALMHPSLHYRGYYFDVVMASVAAVNACVKACSVCLCVHWVYLCRGLCLRGYCWGWCEWRGGVQGDTGNM